MHTLIDAFLIVTALRGFLKSSFYQSYFNTKQRLSNQRPIDVLKSEFPVIWWVLL